MPYFNCGGIWPVWRIEFISLAKQENAHLGHSLSAQQTDQRHPKPYLA